MAEGYIMVIYQKKEHWFYLSQVTICRLIKNIYCPFSPDYMYYTIFTKKEHTNIMF